MATVSLDALIEKEHRLLDHEEDNMVGLDPRTSVDRYMELNHAGMGEDSEELAMRQKATEKMLRERPLPNYQPF
jgi:hypothetical protein